MTKQYLDLARTVLETGATKHDRTGTGTKSIFGHQMRFDLAEGFPILTTKKVAFSLIKSELLWFLKGDTNIKYLLENNNHIWDEWAFERYVKSADYAGPNMDDFGHRVLKEEGFKEIYAAEMAKFREAILTRPPTILAFWNISGTVIIAAKDEPLIRSKSTLLIGGMAIRSACGTITFRMMNDHFSPSA